MGWMERSPPSLTHFGDIRSRIRNLQRNIIVYSIDAFFYRYRRCHYQFVGKKFLVVVCTTKYTTMYLLDNNHRRTIMFQTVDTSFYDGRYKSWYIMEDNHNQIKLWLHLPQLNVMSDKLMDWRRMKWSSLIVMEWKGSCRECVCVMCRQHQ